MQPDREVFEYNVAQEENGT